MTISSDITSMIELMKLSSREREEQLEEHSRKYRSSTLDQRTIPPEHLEVSLVEGDHKYIHYRQGGEEGIVSTGDTHHYSVFETLDDHIQKSSVTGGGFIKLDVDEKTIAVYGTSGTFGRADHVRVQRVLEKVYEDYEVKVRGGE